MDNIIMDSGTTLTFLQDFYNKLESTLSKAIKLKHINKLVTTQGFAATQNRRSKLQ
ncbi:hypothetical protein GBA52_015171 [Prunus armeniaca]|nr:hypothetical protein GBA52_015171 [Prunus armeniaca]